MKVLPGDSVWAKLISGGGMWTQMQDSRNGTQLRNSFDTVKPQKSKTVWTGKVSGTQLSGTSQQRETIYPKDNEGRGNRWGTQLQTKEETLTKIKQEETQRNTKRQKGKDGKGEDWKDRNEGGGKKATNQTETRSRSWNTNDTNQGLL